MGFESVQKMIVFNTNLDLSPAQDKFQLQFIYSFKLLEIFNIIIRFVLEPSYVPVSFDMHKNNFICVKYI